MQKHAQSLGESHMACQRVHFNEVNGRVSQNPLQGNKKRSRADRVLLFSCHWPLFSTNCALVEAVRPFWSRQRPLRGLFIGDLSQQLFLFNEVFFFCLLSPTGIFQEPR